MRKTKKNDQIRVVIVGHVDHGKSTFIGRFLYDTNNLTSDKWADLKKTSEESGKKLEFAHVMDQFQEERDENVTIDTAQAFFQLNNRPYVFIDAPGHKEYLKNMITGATQADHAIILLDVAEGVREQTEKHIQIIKLLRIQEVAVLINKMDIIGFGQKKYLEIQKVFKNLVVRFGLKVSIFIPLSAYYGDNIVSRGPNLDWYKGPTVYDYLSGLEPLESNEKNLDQSGMSLFPVQLVYGRNGNSLFLGRIESGIFKKKDEVYVFPSGRKETIKKILRYKEDLQLARVGESVAMALSSPEGVERGSLLCLSELPPKPVKIFSAHVFWSDLFPLKEKDTLILECRTQKVKCRVNSIENWNEKMRLDQIPTGEIAKVKFNVLGPVLLFSKEKNSPFSRVVFRKGENITGCGLVDEVINEM